jgi:hypothetical protein
MPRKYETTLVMVVAAVEAAVEVTLHKYFLD